MSQNTPISPIDHFEEQELRRVQCLREALIAGENSGQPQSFDREALLLAFLAQADYNG